MPIVERDPWRLQYFDHVACPADVLIPTDDPDSWLWYPRHRWIYDKLRIAQSQGLASAPHGVAPQSYPVFSKPIVNLKGMGIGSRTIADADEMERAYTPGHMWMELLSGAHVSTDCAVEAGAITWMRHATGHAWNDGMFKYWTIHAERDGPVDAYLRQWVQHHLRDYTGMMNFETIGGRIIEVHLRFADQWCDLYGAGWVEALVGLYARGHWVFADDHRATGYSVPLFARHGEAFRHPSSELQDRIRALPHVSSLQITFHESKDPGGHAMPPGGFRVAIVNCTDLEAGLAARREVAKAFPQHLLQIPD